MNPPRKKSRPSELHRVALLAGALALLFPGIAPAEAKESLTPPKTRRIVAISDIHGAYENLCTILQTTNLIDSKNRWIGGDSVFVQTGDFLDRGPNTRKVARLLMDLQEQAPTQGGEVVVLLGNHEVLNIISDMRYVSDLATFAARDSEAQRQSHCETRVQQIQDDIQNAGGDRPEAEKVLAQCLAQTPPGLLEYQEEMSPRGEIGAWLRSLPAAAKIGDTLFLHGGISPKKRKLSIQEINERVRWEIETFDRIRAEGLARGYIFPGANLQAVVAGARTMKAKERRLPKELKRDLDEFTKFKEWFLVAPEGPLWFRGYAKWSEEEGSKEIARILAAQKARHVVVGHTPQKQFSILGRFDNRVFLIDTGMLSSYYKGRASALEIRNGEFQAVYVDGVDLLLGSEAGHHH